jgi:predicted GH43/DUF377 family glycosyl hydrolase
MKLKRHQQNPVLEPIKNNKWESKAVFNCGAVYDNDQVHLLYRAIGEYDDYISRLGYAITRDGVNFERKDSPVFEPVEEYEKWGCEDPRITKIEGKFYVTYVALSKPTRKSGGLSRTALISTEDFTRFERHGIITPDGADDRDTVLFPEKIKGKYVMLHRPHNWTKKDAYEENEKLYLRVKEKTIEWPLEEVPDFFPEKPSIWIAYSDNLKDWFGHKVVMKPEREWEELKIGAGPPPIRTEKGWLLIYHGNSWLHNSKLKNYKGEVYNRIYKAGAALLDLKDPSRVIARTKKPILEPQKDYEIFGDVPNVVFPEGMAVIDEELFVYYGAADKTCCLATCKLNVLIDSIFKEK